MVMAVVAQVARFDEQPKVQHIPTDVRWFALQDASDRPVDVVRSTPPKTKEDLLRLMEQTSAEMAKARVTTSPC